MRVCAGNITTRTSPGLIRTVRSVGTEMTESVRDQLFGKNGMLSPSCAVISLTLMQIAMLNSRPLDHTASPPLMQHIGENLVKLSLGQNELQGTIPDAIGEYCANLEWIFLAYNPGITGPIPENWSKLRKLRKMDMGGTSVSGPIPENLFNGATALREIDLSGTQITGGIPANIVQLTQLMDLRLFETKLSGDIPKGMINLKKLHYLDLDTTELTPPAGATGMSHFSLGECSAFLALL